MKIWHKSKLLIFLVPNPQVDGPVLSLRTLSGTSGSRTEWLQPSASVPTTSLSPRGLLASTEREKPAWMTIRSSISSEPEIVSEPKLSAPEPGELCQWTLWPEPSLGPILLTRWSKPSGPLSLHPEVNTVRPGQATSPRLNVSGRRPPGGAHCPLWWNVSPGLGLLSFWRKMRF